MRAGRGERGGGDGVLVEQLRRAEHGAEAGGLLLGDDTRPGRCRCARSQRTDRWRWAPSITWSFSARPTTKS